MKLINNQNERDKKTTKKTKQEGLTKDGPNSRLKTFMNKKCIYSVFYLILLLVLQNRLLLLLYFILLLLMLLLVLLLLLKDLLFLLLLLLMLHVALTDVVGWLSGANSRQSTASQPTISATTE